MASFRINFTLLLWPDAVRLRKYPHEHFLLAVRKVFNRFLVQDKFRPYGVHHAAIWTGPWCDDPIEAHHRRVIPACIIRFTRGKDFCSSAHFAYVLELEISRNMPIHGYY